MVKAKDPGRQLRSAVKTVRKTTPPAPQQRQPGPSTGQTWSADDVVQLQRRAGNTAVSSVLQRAPGPDPAPVTPQSIDAALKSISVASSKTTQVNSLRPWEIFKTLPWNPSDGGKKRLYSALRKAHSALRRANVVLAEARVREAAAAKAGAPAGTAPAAPVPKPAPKRKAKRAKAKKAKRLPTVAEAQEAVSKAEATVKARTSELKTYVKGKLDTRRNPLIGPQRQEKADAAAELRHQSAALRAATKKKRPDAALVAELTTRRDAAQARVDKAASALSAKLTELRAEIDTADWGEQQVGQTVAVYEVAGSKATLMDRVEAYATVTEGGFEGSAARNAGGGPTVPELLAKDATLGPSTRKILALISRFEGGFSAVNTWDIADVTFGMVQWTTGASGHGDLIKALTIMKQAAPDAFADRLIKYGIDVAPTGLVITRPDGSVLTGVPAAKALQADPKLVAVLSTAGTDPALQAAQLRAANEIEVRGALSTKVSVRIPATTKGGKPVTLRIPVSAMITSEFGVGVLANHTVHGGFPGGDLTRAANAFAAGHHLVPADLATWAPTLESDLVTAISKGNDADRIAAMKKELDTAAGSFN
ncbi:MAG TPA: hypothetical protein VLL08_16525 [Kineosporiaceae bacterium]|nr:hypothetical protein [Kineosporiaceae bacterium]